MDYSENSGNSESDEDFYNKSDDECSSSGEQVDVAWAYNLEALEKYETTAKNPFIISCEFPRSKQPIKGKKNTYRQYYLFESFDIFLNLREEYPNCHEIMANHINNGIDTAGRLFFDIDSKKKPTKNFKAEFEKLLMDIFEKYTIGIDLTKILFIWASTTRKNKFSKHLTVKNIYFDDWINLSKLFFEFVSIELQSNKVIDVEYLDNEIYKAHASMRMVGSSKIDGYCLILDNPNFKLEDSLIRIYNEKNKKKEQHVTIDNFRISSIKKCGLLEYLKIEGNNYCHVTTMRIPRNFEKKSFMGTEYEYIFNLVMENIDKIQPNTFFRSSRESYCAEKKTFSMDLDRINPNYCIYTDNRIKQDTYTIHDSHGAYIFVSPVYIDSSKDNFVVSIGCYKKSCSEKREKKTIRIGRILNKEFHPEDAYYNIKTIDQ